MPSPPEIEFIESVKRYSHTDWARGQRAEPVCDAAIRYFFLLGSPSVLHDDFRLHQAPLKRPPLSEVGCLSDKGRLCTDDDGILLLVWKFTPPAPVCPDKPGGRAARLLDDKPTRIYIPQLTRPWIMQECHANTSCHLSFARTFPMLERFY